MEGRLTRSHRRVLQLLADGCYGEPCGKDELGARIVVGNGQTETFNAPTINHLMSEGLIRIGEVWNPLELTPRGKAKVAELWPATNHPAGRPA